MNRLVCRCLYVYEDKITQSYIKHKGNVDKIIEETQATLACGRCLHKDSTDTNYVDISFPEKIKELKGDSK